MSEVEVENAEDENYQKAINYCADDIHAEDLVKESEKKMINLTKLKENKDGKANDLAQEIWQKYISKNKDKGGGEDEWKIKDWASRKAKIGEIPKGFWDNCTKKKKIKCQYYRWCIQQVINYCSLQKGARTEYIEEDK